MSSVEIEDVLSSIRRLVSEDLRPSSRGAARPGAGDPLVLTPALRVVSESEDPAWDEVAAPAAAAQDLAPPYAETPDDAAWEESDLAEGGWAMPDLAALRRNPEARLIDTAREASRPHRFTLTQAMAVPPAARDDDPVAEATRPDAFDLRSVAAVGEDLASDDLAPEAHGGAALDPAVFPGGESFDPADAAFDDGDPAMADLDAQAMADLATEAFIDSDLMPEGPEVTYDEDLLRDLVRDLIREELAGDLGEKITRNIRKLVRAEIAQALATRALE